MLKSLKYFKNVFWDFLKQLVSRGLHLFEDIDTFINLLASRNTSFPFFLFLSITMTILVFFGAYSVLKNNGFIEKSLRTAVICPVLSPTLHRKRYLISHWPLGAWGIRRHSV